MIREYVAGRVQAAKMRRLTYVVFIGVFALSGLAMVGVQMIRQAAAEGGYTWSQVDKYPSTPKSWGGIVSSSDGVRLSSYVWGDAVYTSSDSGETWVKQENSPRYLYDLASSTDGLTLIGVAGTQLIYISTDAGATWTERTEEITDMSGWRHVSMSADGSRVVIMGTEREIKTSDDGGATWSERSLGEDDGMSHFLVDVVSSSDGMRLALINSNNIYTSNDAGLSWTKQIDAGARQWGSLAMSGDGMKIAGHEISTLSYVYTSSDGGTTWTENTGLGKISLNQTSLGYSLDGDTLAAVEFNGIHISNDNGASWITHPNPAGSESIGGVRISSDGQKIAIKQGVAGYIYVSLDGGNNFVKASVNDKHSWQSIVSSNDGQKLVAVAANDYIYISHDSGETWEPKNEKRQWTDVAISNDGARITASADYLYISTDGGNTWNRSGIATSWNTVASSADGMSLVASDGSSDGIYISSNGGDTWTQRLGTPSGIVDVASSTNGQKLVAVGSGLIITSSDGGATWTQRVSSGVWKEVASSDDGVNLIAARNATGIFTSSDSGATWVVRTLSPGSLQYGGVASSSDGTTLAFATWGSNNEGSIYTSTNGGTSWKEQTSLGLQDWLGVTLSSDGEKAFGVNATSMWKATYATTVPDAPYSLSGSAASSSVVELEWGEPENGGSPITDYKVEYSSDGITWATYPHTPSTNTDMNITGLQPSTDYFFQVSAINAVGIGQPSDAIQVQTLVPAIPNPPQHISVEAGNKSTHLQWSAYSGDIPIDAYEIQYRKSTESSWHTASQTLASNATSFTVSQLTPAKQYEFRIRSYYWVGSEKVASSWAQESVTELPHYDLPDALALGIFSKANSVAVSDDGKYIIGGFDDGTLHSSSNGGATWQEEERADTGSEHLMVTVSKDGSKVLRSSGEQSGTSLYKMDTATGTWQTVLSPAGTLWTAGSIANDGQVLYASGLELGTFTPLFKKSTDGGVTWHDLAPVGSDVVVSLAVADDGALYATTIGLVGGPASARFYRSSDVGTTWTQVSLSTATGYVPASVSTSADGSSIVVTLLNYDEQVAVPATSIDGGVTWTLGSRQVDTGFWAGSDGLVTFIDGDIIGSYKASPLVATPYGAATGGSDGGGHSGGGTTSQNPGSSGQTPKPQSPSASAGDVSVSSTLKVDGGTLADTDTISHTPTFSGQADPYDHIIVTVHSDPVTCETDADASGYWECTLSEALPAGEHTVVVKVTSATDGSVQEYGPYTVTVEEDATDTPTITPETPEGTQNEQSSDNASFWGWVAGIGAILVIAIIIAGIRRSRRTAA